VALWPELTVEECQLGKFLLNNLILVLLQLFNIPVGVQVSSLQKIGLGSRKVSREAARKSCCVLCEWLEGLDHHTTTVLGNNHAGMDGEDAEIRLLDVENLAQSNDGQLGGAVARHGGCDKRGGQTDNIDKGALAARYGDVRVGDILHAFGVDLKVLPPGGRVLGTHRTHSHGAESSDGNINLAERLQGLLEHCVCV
jgi:hypothetical protein